MHSLEMRYYWKVYWKREDVLVEYFAQADANITEAFVSLSASHEINDAVLDQLEMFTCSVRCPAIKGN